MTRSAVTQEGPSTALESDRGNYVSGETATLTGAGFAPWESIDLRISIDQPVTGAHVGDAVWPPFSTDADGGFVATYEVPPEAEGMMMSATATGMSSGLTATTLMNNPAQVATDQADYEPGSLATIYGSGFLAGEEVGLHVVNVHDEHEEEYEHQPWTAVADGNGDFVTTWTVCGCVGETMRLTASGLSSGLVAAAVFTDHTTTVSPSGFGTFGSSGSSSVSGWTEQTCATPPGTTCGSESDSGDCQVSTSDPNTGAHARLEEDCTITRSITTFPACHGGFSLNYFWRGDSDAEDTDTLLVQVSIGGGAFTTVATHVLDAGSDGGADSTTWFANTVNVTGVPAGTTSIAVRFIGDTNDGAEEARVDDVTVTVTDANHIANGTSCDDGLHCTGTDTCDATGTCVHSGNPCAAFIGDGDSDCSESCNESNDTCTANDPSGSACSDGIFCNGTDTCNSSGSCSNHVGNPCPGPDNDSNCAESCNEAADNCTLPDPNGSDCDDGLFCNGDDSCSAGACTGHEGDPCASRVGDSDSDCTESCNEASNNCTLADPNGSHCSDGDRCTTNDTCSGGTCVGGPLPSECDDGNPCTTDTCQEDDDEIDCGHTNKPSGTACGNPADTDCDNPDTCNGSGSCRANNEASGVGCPDDGETCTRDICNGSGACTHPAGNAGVTCRPDAGDCDVAETCNGTTPSCPANAFDPPNTACGSQADTACDNPDTCNATGQCQTNNVASGVGCPDDGETCTRDICNGDGECVHPAGNAGTTCRPDAGDCDVAETCNGTTPSCPADGFDPPNTACGSQADTACDNPDTCNATGQCQDNHEASGVGCTDDGETCTRDICDGSGECTHPAGNAGVTCRPDAGDCDVAETCDGTTPSCPANGFDPPNTACGSPADTACDNPDTCNATGQCQTNNVASGVGCPDDGETCTRDICNGYGECVHPAGNAGTTCRPDAGDCDVAETCNGTTPSCPPNAFDPPNTACGSQADTDCDNPNTCNATGQCQNNHVTDGTACTTDDNECTADECTNGVCTHDDEPSGTPCGSNTDTDCNHLDTCDGSGECLSNLESEGATCTTDGNPCTVDECDDAGECQHSPSQGDCTSCSAVTSSSLCPLPDDLFRLIYLQDPVVSADGKVNYNAFRLNASNPGQFYYNVFHAGIPGESVSLTINVPYPFVTQGAVPIQVHDGAAVNGGGCFTPLTSVPGCTISTEGGNPTPSGAEEIRIADYGPQNLGDTTQVTVECAQMPASGVLYVTLHLDYGLKKTVGWTQQALNAASHAQFATGDGTVLINDPQEYAFGFGAGTCGVATASSTNVFKKNPGVNGLTLQAVTTNPKAGVKIQLIGPTGKVVGTANTDADGFYQILYKHTGKAANYTVSLPTLNRKQTVQLKANGFAVVLFENLP